jgi:hypothetical protein
MSFPIFPALSTGSSRAGLGNLDIRISGFSA